MTTTVLYEGKDPISADIVFVHGLGGDKLETWTKDTILWPRDLLPAKIPNARVITWGYESDPMRFFQQEGPQNIASHALDLLGDVKMEREDLEDSTRPLIFVGHSLGGLIIKQALCKAVEYTGQQRRHRREAKIAQYCTGIMFMGTPHHGANNTEWTATATRIAGLIGKANNGEIVSSLKSGSSILQTLNDNFARIQDRFNVTTALEGTQTQGLGKIIQDEHAKLDIENEDCFLIQANHGDMCKFTNRTEPGYRKVSAALKEQIEDAEIVLEQRASVMQDSRPTSAPQFMSLSPQNSHQSASSPSTSEVPPPYRSSTHPVNPQTRPDDDDVFGISKLVDALPSYSSPPRNPSVLAQRQQTIEFSQYKALLLMSLSIEGKNPPEKYLSAIEGYKYLKTCSSSVDAFRTAFELESFDQTSRDHLGKFLFLASYVGDTRAAAQALEAGADPNYFAKSVSECPLHGALTFGHPEIIKMLLHRGASLLEFLYAADGEQNEQDLFRSYIRVLPVVPLQLYLDVRGTEAFPSDAALLAAERSQPGVMDLLQRRGFSLAVTDPQGASVLHIATRNSQNHVIEYLVEAGFPVNKPDNFGQSALYDAIMTVKPAICEYLTKNGADVNLKDNNARTPVHVLVSHPCDADGQPLSNDEIDAAKFSMLGDLQLAGASLEGADDNGDRPLHLAINLQQCLTAALLIYIGADVDAVDADGWTPLHLCANGKGSLPEVAEMLISGGASMKSRLPPSYNRMTPLELAKRIPCAQMVQLFKSNRDKRGVAKFLARRGIAV